MNDLKILASLLILGLLWINSCNEVDSEKTRESFLREHITWLSDDERGGRLAGTLNEAEVANYISEQFLQYGLRPAGDRDTYIQQFQLEGPMVQAMDLENRVSRNVVGLIEGETFRDRYIIIGAHYDGQGMGGAISMNMNSEPAIHNSADDNASGTVGLFYLAKEFAENRPQSSILMAAFSGEELGLLGSKYFVDTMEIDPDSVLAMINLDMIGRLDENNLDIFGTGTSPKWEEVLSAVESDSIKITTTPGGMGASDHASFYQVNIPVLHYYTGTHNQYHREDDTADLINYSGLVKVLEHVEGVTRIVDSFSPAEIDFEESTDPRSAVRMRSRNTLGVIPDYSFSGEGLRIEQVRPDGKAEISGFLDGDIIIAMNDSEISDIYEYMNVLNDLQNGDIIPVTIIRNGEILELEVPF